MAWQATITNTKQEGASGVRVFYRLEPTGATVGDTRDVSLVLDMTGKSRPDARREIMALIKSEIDTLNDIERRVANLMADLIGTVIT